VAAKKGGERSSCPTTCLGSKGEGNGTTVGERQTARPVSNAAAKYPHRKGRACTEGGDTVAPKEKRKTVDRKKARKAVEVWRWKARRRDHGLLVPNTKKEKERRRHAGESASIVDDVAKAAIYLGEESGRVETINRVVDHLPTEAIAPEQRRERTTRKELRSSRRRGRRAAERQATPP